MSFKPMGWHNTMQEMLILKIGVVRKLFFKKSSNINCEYFYEVEGLEQFTTDFGVLEHLLWPQITSKYFVNQLKI